MARRLLPAVVVLVTLGILAGGGYLAWQMLTDVAEGGPPQEDVERASAQVEDAVGPEMIDEVRATVSEMHDRLNDAFGYGGLDGPDFDAIEREVADPVGAEVTSLADEVDDPALERDLRSVARFLEIGVERRDQQALAYAHRVLHDLDYFAFNPDSEGRYWGATVTLEGEDNEAQRYLDELETGSDDTDEAA